MSNLPFPLQDITIYHKNKKEKKLEVYNTKASVRNTSIRNRITAGTEDSDNALIRIFDNIENFEKTWNVEKGDIIVDSKVNDEVDYNEALTKLSNTYGKNNVYQVKSIDIFKFGSFLDHIKIGAI